jgi:mannose-6-phosphate isomerase-like protein (cupin superfamily)
MLVSEERPWGRWEECLNEPGYRLKRIIVHPGQRLSLQKHKHRNEYWVIVQGHGKFTLAESETPVSPGDTAFIPMGEWHRVENDRTEILVIIETEIGKCTEDDIIRKEDDYGRV